MWGFDSPKFNKPTKNYDMLNYCINQKVYEMTIVAEKIFVTVVDSVCHVTETGAKLLDDKFHMFEGKLRNQAQVDL